MDWTVRINWFVSPTCGRRAGVEYAFTVAVSKGVIDGSGWNQHRSDNATVIVSTSAWAVPHVAITPTVSDYFQLVQKLRKRCVECFTYC